MLKGKKATKAKKNVVENVETEVPFVPTQVPAVPISTGAKPCVTFSSFEANTEMIKQYMESNLRPYNMVMHTKVDGADDRMEVGLEDLNTVADHAIYTTAGIAVGENFKNLCKNTDAIGASALERMRNSTFNSLCTKFATSCDQIIASSVKLIYDTFEYGVINTFSEDTAGYLISALAERYNKLNQYVSYRNRLPIYLNDLLKTLEVTPYEKVAVLVMDILSAQATEDLTQTTYSLLDCFSKVIYSPNNGLDVDEADTIYANMSDMIASTFAYVGPLLFEQCSRLSMDLCSVMLGLYPGAKIDYRSMEYYDF